MSSGLCSSPISLGRPQKSQKSSPNFSPGVFIFCAKSSTKKPEKSHLNTGSGELETRHAWIILKIPPPQASIRPARKNTLAITGLKGFEGCFSFNCDIVQFSGNRPSFQKMILSLYALICIGLIVSSRLKDFASFPALPFYIFLISFPIPLCQHPCRVIKALNFRCVKKNKLISLIRPAHVQIFLKLSLFPIIHNFTAISRALFS